MGNPDAEFLELDAVPEEQLWLKLNGCACRHDLQQAGRHMVLADRHCEEVTLHVSYLKTRFDGDTGSLT